MEKLKYYSKTISLNILITLVSIFLISFLYYFHITNDFINNALVFLAPLIIIFISSYKTGKTTFKKGYLEGIKIGLMIIAIYFIMTLILFIDSLNIKTLIYYLIIMLVSITGSTIGINKNKGTD